MMQRRTFLPALVALTLIALLTPTMASAGKVVGWELLGQKRVTDRLDHDTLVVTGAKGSFKSLKVKVVGHGVQFRSFKIHFANGGDQNVELRDVIPAGGESRVIDIEGGDRVIRSIEMTYDAQALRGRKAKVQVFGRN